MVKDTRATVLREKGAQERGYPSRPSVFLLWSVCILRPIAHPGSRYFVSGRLSAAGRIKKRRQIYFSQSGIGLSAGDHHGSMPSTTLQADFNGVAVTHRGSSRVQSFSVRVNMLFSAYADVAVAFFVCVSGQAIMFKAI